MPRNLEIKVQINSVDEIRSLLEKLSAEQAGMLNQKDIYYKYKSGLAKLRVENGSFQFITYNRNEGEGDRWSDYNIITMSGERIEETLAGLLDVETIVEKKRELWWYNNTRIHLDTVEGLGSFLELETKVTGDEEDARVRYRFLYDALNLSSYPEYRLSYRDLVLEKKGSE
jgi:predicted adenylyl cyclase CyaB